MFKIALLEDYFLTHEFEAIKNLIPVKKNNVVFTDGNKIEITEPTRISVVFKTPLKGKFEIFRISEGGGLTSNYYREFAKPQKAISLNLYKNGVYLVPGETFVKNMGKVKTKKIDLPPPQWNYGEPDLNLFTQVYNANLDTTPLRVFRDKKIIEYNDAFAALPEQVKDAALWHEMGHMSYKDEIFADRFACKMLSEKGGNISQLFHAIALTCKNNDLNKRRLEIIKSLGK